jgi:hypothetical protein
MQIRVQFMSEKLVKTQQKVNWCKKYSHELSRIPAGFFCLTENPKGCDACSESAIRAIINFPCSERKTAFDCLGANGQTRCDYVCAGDSIFECVKPKGSMPMGKSTIITEVKCDA